MYNVVQQIRWRISALVWSPLRLDWIQLAEIPSHASENETKLILTVYRYFKLQEITNFYFIHVQANGKLTRLKNWKMTLAAVLSHSAVSCFDQLIRFKWLVSIMAIAIRYLKPASPFRHDIERIMTVIIFKHEALNRKLWVMFVYILNAVSTVLRWKWQFKKNLINSLVVKVCFFIIFNLCYKEMESIQSIRLGDCFYSKSFMESILLLLLLLAF